MGFELKERIGVRNFSQTTLSAKTPGAAGSSAAERARAKKTADPVCIEMPVRVRGIAGLPIGGTSELGQDFVEDTRTLIVMPAGGIVRMATRVKKGQLLGLKHLRTDQEVSCRVVNVRGSGTPEDYVEVEFTQRAKGFWGIHFPNDSLSDEASGSQAAPTPGEVEAERVIFGGGHEERGSVSVGPSTVGTPPKDAKAGLAADGKTDAKIERPVSADLVKPEPAKAAPVDAPGFTGLSKEAEVLAAAAERRGREDALIREQTQTNIISFPGPATHQEKANIFAESEADAPLAAKLDFSPVEDAAPKPAVTDAEAEHAAIAKAIDDKAARENADAQRRAREEAERGAAERLAGEKAAAEKAAADRLAAAHAEFERIEAEKRAEADRLAAEKAAAEKAAAEKAAADKKRLAAEQAEFERREAERRAEAERGVAERRAAAERRGIESVSGTAASSRMSLGTGLGGTAYGTLEKEIQRDRAALKTAKSIHTSLVGAAGLLILALAAGGWWYTHSGATPETSQGVATSSLPSSSAANVAADSAAAGPASASDNGRAVNPANPNATNGMSTNAAPAPWPVATTANAPNVSSSAGSSGANAKPQPVAASVDDKKTDNKKTASARDTAALEAAAASELARGDATNAEQPAEAHSKSDLKATLSAPVVKRNAAESGDAAAPEISSTPPSEEPPPLVGAVTSSNVPAAPPTPRVGGQVTPPRLLKSAATEYPILARQRRIEGDVVVEARVDENGRVAAAKVLSGPELLREAALTAVRQFKYAPAQLNGNPTTAQVLVTVKFRTR